MFGATYIGNGKPLGNVSKLKSPDSSITEGLFMDYYYNGLIVDEYVDRIWNNQGNLIFKSQEKRGRMVAYNAPAYRTVYGTFVFGGIIDGYDINTKKVLMNRLLSFLLYINPPIEMTLNPVISQVHRGGILEIKARLENTTVDETIDFTSYANVHMPSGVPCAQNPVKGPTSFSFPPGKVLNYSYSHAIPRPAPLGTYTYVGVVRDEENNVLDIDAFEFTVLPE